MRILRLIFLSVLLCTVGFFLWKKPLRSPSSANPYPVSEEKPFVILIPSYNNESYVEKNLRSVFSQNYNNYRVIYIDDHSSDQTLQKTSLLLTELDHENRTSLIHNSQNHGGLANVYNAVHTCHGHEIVVLLDGDDFFAHENVLKRLNEIYANPEVWITYGNNLEYPSYRPSKFNTSINRSHFSSPPLRSFYAALFKKIDTQDLIYRGRFYPMAWDLAIMLPMIEMANHHAHFIDETLYLSNSDNPLCNQTINPNYLAECEQYIRSKTPYSPLKKLRTTLNVANEKSDLLIFSHDHPMQLFALLESVGKYVTGLNKVSVLYRASSTHIDTAYLDVKLHFPTVHFIKQKTPPTDFKKLTNSLIFDSTIPSSGYIVFAPDTLIIKEPIDLSIGISTLEETNAFALFYSLSETLSFCSILNRFQPIPVHTPLPGIPAQEPPLLWEFAEGVDDFNTPNTLLFALYRKTDLNKIFPKIDFDTPKELLFEWGQKTPHRPIGLFFPKAKVIDIHPPKTNEFLELFNTGLKIDIRPLSQIEAPSQQIEKPFIFTSK